MLNKDIRSKIEKLNRIIHAHEGTLEYKVLEDGVGGTHQRITRTINVGVGGSLSDTLLTLIHETAHLLDFAYYGRDPKEGFYYKDKTLYRGSPQEVLSYSVEEHFREKYKLGKGEAYGTRVVAVSALEIEKTKRIIEYLEDQLATLSYVRDFRLYSVDTFGNVGPEERYIRC